jgi:hypothetical protein
MTATAIAADDRQPVDAVTEAAPVAAQPSSSKHLRSVTILSSLVAVQLAWLAALGYAVHLLID